ncbi:MULTISPECIES: NAD(P)-binding domain-containing protein [unclassified Streptomyces]|uniref:NAD(P)-binding domain-containing protein n=1 Tax=unclassified Streptomyces TaxID=2593676 RepID=UPI00224EB26A|nr:MULTISPECIES: NAD(P)-binding domain-containing protein [unclassified Streptomyces]MCX4526310.1 NAD(P)-binding domain-containing protein [Streptomyces sp. NBC_01551]MCX4543126.1 NAD(P)-binding domain-containing protein [Streptomyces sp. NBC_01565]
MDDLVVVGAGPYGLSIAAHAAAAGLDVRLLGRPMASWRDHMPEGMYLKSEPWSSNLSSPDGRYTLAAYCATRGITAEHGTPLPIGTFSAYGLWFARHAAPAVEEVTVTEVTPQGEGFRIRTAEGPPLLARTVALAVGVMPFVHHPEALRGLPPGHYSHSSGHRDLSRFAGREVAVLGAGQAALETAALLAERGARPCLIARRARLNWNTVPQPLERPVLRALREPHSGLGTGWRSWVWAELPWAVRRLPAPTRERIAATALGPAGAWWLRDRFERRVPALLGHRLHRAVAVGERTRLRLTSPAGEPVVLDAAHVIAATGFSPDLGRLGLLDAGLRSALATVGGGVTPDLDAGFESSWPGLFFAGLLTAPSFGPSMRFVHGAGFTAGRLVKGVLGRLGARGPLPGSTGGVRADRASAGHPKHPKTYLR